MSSAAGVSCVASSTSSSTCGPRSNVSKARTGIAAPPTRCSRTSTSSARSGPKYVVVLAGDHIYKMDYTRMIADHVESGADCTVGCIEVPRMDARGVRRDARGREPPRHRLRRKARGPTRHAGPPGHRARQHGHLRVQCGLPVFAARRKHHQRRHRSRLRQGHPAARGHARPRDRPSIQHVVRVVGSERASRTGAMSARSTPTGPPIWTSPQRSRRSTCTPPTGRSGRSSSSYRPPSSCAT